MPSPQIPEPERPWALLDTIAGLAWRTLVIAAALALATFVIIQVKVVVVPLLLALLLSSILQPVVRRLRDKGLNAGLSATLTVLAAVTVLGAIALLVLPSLVSQVDDIANAVSDALDDIYAWLEGPPLDMSAKEVADIRHDIDSAGPATGDVLIDGISALVPLVAQVVGLVVFTVVFTGYLLADGDRYWRWLLGFVQPDRQAALDQLGRKSYATLAAYIRGTAAVATVDAVFIGLGFWILGIPQAIPLAVLVFFGAFLPIIGAWLVGIIGVLIALADGGIGLALGAGAIILLVQQLEGTFLQPFMVGSRVSLAPIVTLATVTIGTTLAGVVGGILAVPLVATVSGALGEVRRWRMQDQGHSAAALPEPAE